jgi:hypothetical protein
VPDDEALADDVALDESEADFADPDDESELDEAPAEVFDEPPARESVR